MIDAEITDYFAEELVEGHVRKKTMLNPNRKSDREVFAETFDEIPNVIDAENELQKAFESNNVSRIEWIDKGIARMLQKSGKKVEGKPIGTNQSKEKKKIEESRCIG